MARRKERAGRRFFNSGKKKRKKRRAISGGSGAHGWDTECGLSPRLSFPWVQATGCGEKVVSLCQAGSDAGDVGCWNCSLISSSGCCFCS